IPLKIRSLVGVIPLFAIETLEVSSLLKLPGFARRFNWFLRHRPDLAREVTCNGQAGACERRLLSIVPPEQLRPILQRLLSEEEFLGPYGIRSISRFHQDHPYVFRVNGTEHRVDYEPAESTTGLFGGNSNWRGPVWMPLNFLLIEALQKFHHFLGDDFRIECPTGSGRMMTLWEVAGELSHRLIRIFQKDEEGRRPVYGGTNPFQHDPHWKDLILFYEYFHGDNGAGIGASHQTGWTGLIAKLIQQCGERCTHHRRPPAPHAATPISPLLHLPTV
ncbi:MAG: glucosidase, partial [Elusimicrobia bacterium]|nr:glucosidase [Elusimicrobiota bacterium]